MLWDISAFAFLSYFSLTAGLAQTRLLGTVNPSVRHADDRGRVDADRKLSHLTLTFRRTPEQRESLHRLLEDQQNPSSPNYHRWLTPEEFGDRFGVSQDVLDMALTWLRSEGFTIESTARSRSWIVFSGTVRQIEKALRTEIHHYQTNGRMHFSPAAPPSVPTEIAAVVGSVRGLDDFYVEAPRRHWSPMLNLTDGTHALAPGDVVRIYRSDWYDGNGQSIVVVGQSGIDPSDIENFRSLFGLPLSSPQTVLIGDDPGLDQNGGMLEAVADLEWAGGVAPRANLIYVYAKDVFDAVQAAVDQNLAPVISISYGRCEANLPRPVADSIQNIAQQANAQGITLIASSGDAGAATCDMGKGSATQGLSVSFPASLPEVTGVGGTQFNEGSGTYWNDWNRPDYSSAQNYIPETAWNDTAQRSVLAASGGGASIFYAKPSWQSAPGVPEKDSRWVPDVSFSASHHDPYVVISGKNVYSFSGTSASAPVFAGVMALFNQRATLFVPGWTGAGNINPLLYGEAASQASASAFHDITTGDNIVPCTNGTPDCANGSLGFSAGPGYDPVTGLGSLNVNAFVGRPVSTTTTLTLPASVAVEGQVIVNVTVATGFTAPPNAERPNQGAVQILANGESAGWGNLVAGTAAIPLQISSGTWTLTARFQPDSSWFAPSMSAPATIIVTPDAPAPALISPANRAAGLAPAVDLKWNGARYATSYDVYLGTASSPPFWRNTTSFNGTATGLALNTTYYWKVIANTLNGPISSPVWSFSTTDQPGYTISTLAGTGQFGSSGDGGPAAQAALDSPGVLAVDRIGNLYVAEFGTKKVRMITPSGIISTVAGSGGTITNSGDGGLATAAGLAAVNGLATDPDGNLYIASGNRVRVVAPNGTISTFAGSGTGGYSGDGGPASAAQLTHPAGLALDGAGNLYIADPGAYCVRKVSAGMISTVAGQCGHAGFSGDRVPAVGAALLAPVSLAVDSAGSLYIADTFRIRKVTAGVMTTVAGGASAISASQLAMDHADNLFFTTPGVVYRIAGGSPAAIAGVSSGTGFSPGDGLPATSVQISAFGIAAGPGGLIYITDANRVRILTPSGSSPSPSIASGDLRTLPVSMADLWRPR